MTTTLAELDNGATAVLKAVEGERAYRRRLLELGFVPGTSVRMVRNIPIGDVLEVELRHSRVSLRISEARAITVERSEGGPAHDDPPGGGGGSST